MTATSRIGTTCPSITVVDTTARLLVHWHDGDRAACDRLARDFRATFPTHADASWRGADRCWSVPAGKRARLAEWVAASFPADRVTWVGLHTADAAGEIA